NGAVNIQQGALAVANIDNTGVNQALGTSASAITLGSSTVATLSYTGAGAGTTDRAIVLGGTGGGIITSTTALLTLNGGIDTTSNGYGLTLSGGNNVTVATVGISGTGSVTKTGAGTAIVSANNTF